MLWIRSDPSTLVSHQRQLMVQNKSTHQLLPIRGDKMTRWNGTQGHLWKWQINQHHMVHSHDYHGPNCKNVRNRKERLLSKKVIRKAPNYGAVPPASICQPPQQRWSPPGIAGTWRVTALGTKIKQEPRWKKSWTGWQVVYPVIIPSFTVFRCYSYQLVQDFFHPLWYKW